MTDCASPTRPGSAAPGPFPDDAALLEALHRPDADAAIGAALTGLDANADPQLAAGTVRALARCGVPGLALRLLRTIDAGEGVAAVREEIGQLPSGEVPWAELADRYRANLRALMETRPHLCGVLDPAMTPPADVHLFITRTGNAQVVRDDPDGALRFVFPFGDHHRNAETLALGEVKDGAGFLLVGVPSVPLLKRLLALRLPSGYRPPIDMVETGLPVLVTWLHMLDELDGLAAPRVNVFAGANALDQYERSRIANLWRSGPTHTLTNHRPGWRPPAVDVAFQERVHAAVAARRGELLAKQDAFYRRQGIASWAERFRQSGVNGPSLRIVGFATRYSTVTQYVMRDLKCAFERQGCVFTLVKEPDDSCNDIDTWTTLAEQPYDLVIVLHHLRAQLADRVHPNVPYVCWIQDHMQRLCTKEAGRSVGPLDLVLGHGRGLMTSLYDYPADRFIATSNLTDPETYDDAPVPPEDLAPYRCDVSFIGHGSATVEEMIDGLAAEAGERMGDYLRCVLGLLRRAMIERGWASFVDLLACMLDAESATEGMEFTASQRRHRIFPIVQTLFDRLVRHEALEWGARWAEARGRRFRIFGRGWEKHPTLARFAGGVVPNGYGLRCACQATAVNLQINGYASLHQRLLDAVVSGGFVLSRFNPSDFVRGPLLALGEFVEREDITDLKAIADRAARSNELAALLEEIDRLGGPRAMPMSDPRRQREAHAMRAGYDFPDHLLDDAAQFESIITLRYQPPRAAGEIPGFAQTVFGSQEELHGLLDRFVDDEAARREMTAPMRRWVAEHGTYDRLVKRILEWFGSLA